MKNTYIQDLKVLEIAHILGIKILGIFPQKINRKAKIIRKIQILLFQF